MSEPDEPVAVGKCSFHELPEDESEDSYISEILIDNMDDQLLEGTRIMDAADITVELRELAKDCFVNGFEDNKLVIHVLKLLKSNNT
jgi:hypothetical protein